MRYVTKMLSLLANGILVLGLAGTVQAQQESAHRHEQSAKPASLRAMMDSDSGGGDMCRACGNSGGGGMGMGMSGMKGKMCMQGKGGMMSRGNGMGGQRSAEGLATADLLAMVPVDVEAEMHDLAGKEIEDIQDRLNRQQTMAEGKMLKAKGALKMALAAERVDRDAVNAALRSYADAQSEWVQARLEARASLQALTAPATR